MTSRSTTLPPSAESSLRQQLEQRSQEVAELKAQLDALGAADLAEAESLGILESVEATELPVRQQQRLAAAIVREARKNKLDPLLVTALIQVESSFDSYARSTVGALGLMQVMPETGRWLLKGRKQTLRGPLQLYDYELNLELGTAYLADLIQRFGSVESALLAYNAGPGNARKILAAEESRRQFWLGGYPKKVLSMRSRLRSEHRPQLVAATLSQDR